jgi:hypothetical protein
VARRARSRLPSVEDWSTTTTLRLALAPVLARPRWSQEHHVLPALDEVQGPEVGDHVPAQRALVVVVELLEGLGGRGSGRHGCDLPAVELVGGGECLLDAPWVTR